MTTTTAPAPAPPTTWLPTTARPAPTGRTVEALVLPYGETTYTAPGQPLGERFAPDAFTDVLRAQPVVPVTARHAGPVLGAVTGWESSPDGLIATITMNDTANGRQAIEFIRSGKAGFSIGFQPRAARRDGHVRVVTAADVDHVALLGADLGTPAYTGTGVLAMRTADRLHYGYAAPSSVDTEPEWHRR